MLGAGLGASGIGGLVGGGAGRSVRQAARAGGDGAHLFARVARLRPGADAAVFFLGRIVQGVGIGGDSAIGHGMLAEAVPPAFRGRAAAFLQSGEPVGVAIAAIVGYLVLRGWAGARC